MTLLNESETRGWKDYDGGRTRRPSMFHRNRLLQTDSYKHSHFLQYPEGTTHVFSYIESRGGDYDELMFFGIQAFIKEYLLEPITLSEIEEARDVAIAHGIPFNHEGWMHILNKHGGRLPLDIKAVPEGTVVPYKNALVTVVNTDPETPWLTSFFETVLLRAVWYPTQVATTSFRIKKIINKYLNDTGDPSLLPFKLHDFGARGVSSDESAMLGGMSHLVNFMGTDTMTALMGVRNYYGDYNKSLKEDIAGFSIAAAEHSTMTIKGRDGEFEQVKRLIKKFGGIGKIYAIVGDSYNIYDFIRKHLAALKELIIETGGTLVVRPDSGDPVKVTLEVVEALDEVFGNTINTKGFKVLHPSVRMIQGDGVCESSIAAILANFMAHRWSADNIAFGMGGALLQHHTRDDNKWAMKASAAKINGEWVDVFKDPITDKGKQSKKGRLMLTADYNWKNFKTEVLDTKGGVGLSQDPALLRVFLDGSLIREEVFNKVRERAASQLV